MHPNPVFRQTPADRNLAAARDRGFGVLSVNGPDGPVASHVPFVLSADGSSAELHLVRSTPLARSLTAPQNALLIVSGPDSYVSPDWYATDHQVPTWNYVAIHLHGTLTALPPSEMRGQLDRLSAEFESRLLPKTPWTADKMPPDQMERLMRAILPCRFAVTDVQGTWKLNQNKSASARLLAADHIARAGLGQETATLAALMRDSPPERA